MRCDRENPEGVTIGSDPWGMPNPVLLMLIILVTAVAVPVLLVRGLLILMGRRGRPARVPTGLATVGAGLTLAVYGWGALHLVRDETMAASGCKSAVGPALAGQVSGYDPSLVPLGFTCLISGGGRYDVFVPGWVNPTVLVLLVLTVFLVLVARTSTDATSQSPGR